MAELGTIDRAKQGTRHFVAVASDKLKIATSTVSRGDTHDVDVAVIKATTSQFHVVPKEKHVHTLKATVLSSRAACQYVIRELRARKEGATDWLTTLKTLMTMHRLMRETSMTFMKEAVKEPREQAAKGRLLAVDNFIDTTNIDGRFEYSEFARAYGRYLDEQLAAYEAAGFYQEQEQGTEQSRLRSAPAPELLAQLPVLQRLLSRLAACKPAGAAAKDPVVLGALFLVLKESFKVYKAISEGIINLADRFFEMDALDAGRGLEIYKQAIVDSGSLQGYYRACEQLEELKRAIQFPKLEPPPADFLQQMEDYAREAPRAGGEAGDAAAAAAKKKSPPLRKGRLLTKASREGPAPDPGMVLSFGKAAQAAAAANASPAPSRPDSSADLLSFMDQLSVSSDQGSSAPNPHGPSPQITGGSANGQAGAHLPPLQSFQEEPAGSQDPFASFDAAPAFTAPPGPPTGSSYASNPFSTPTPSSSNPFSTPTPHPQGGAGQGLFPQQASPSPPGANPGQGLGQSAAQATPPKPFAGFPGGSSAPVGGPSKKEAAPPADPFADLAGFQKAAPKASPPLRALGGPANPPGAGPTAAASPAGGSAFPSPGAFGAGPSAAGGGPQGDAGFSFGSSFDSPAAGGQGAWGSPASQGPPKPAAVPPQRPQQGPQGGARPAPAAAAPQGFAASFGDNTSSLI